nr:hypothetical protein [Fulvimarina manganoxydans]
MAVHYAAFARSCAPEWKDVVRAPVHIELGHERGQLLHFTGEIAGGGGRFFHHRRVLLGELIHRGDSPVHLFQAACLFLSGIRNVMDDRVDLTDLRDDPRQRLFSLSDQLQCGLASENWRALLRAKRSISWANNQVRQTLSKRLLMRRVMEKSASIFLPGV